MKKILYLGTSLDRFSSKDNVLYYPVLHLVPKSDQDKSVLFCLSQLQKFSHCLITSKNTVQFLFNLAEKLSLDLKVLLQQKCVSIGPFTSRALREKGVEPLLEVRESTQEGVISLLKEVLITELQYVFYPKSSLSRPLLTEFLIEEKIPHEVLNLYDTLIQSPSPIPLLDEVEEIIFSSPSTVEGFFKIFKKIPKGIKITFQGPITEKAFHSIAYLRK